MNLILFIACIFLITFILGKLLERIHIPWIFSALLIGLALAAYNPFPEETASPSFLFLANLGMLFLLFIIGFELDIKKILHQGKFIVKTTAVIIIAETVFGSLLIHYLFNTPWLVSVLVASSFATVGEAVLLPILDKFRLIKTRLGQTILGIGVLDDVVEILTIGIVVIMLGRTAGHAHFNIWVNALILGGLFFLVFVLFKLQKQIRSFKLTKPASTFLLVLFVLFLFVGIGQYVESAALGAILAGIALRNVVPEKRLRFIKSEVRTVSYGFFAPIFFVWVGLDTDIGYLVKFPLLVILVMAMTNSTKIISSYVMGRKVLGAKKSVILGISLSVKFSTSIVIIKLLLENGIIQSNLYSVLVGTTIAFKFVIPALLAYLITKWKIVPSQIPARQGT